ncbi:hypothetical protein [Streptomyces sp. NPDC047009]|uniref:hypothetical protein n=1 Tax=Streptomyces sp. NPDC047009 TaxID=3154496 RepID=UPI0033CD074B
MTGVAHHFQKNCLRDWEAETVARYCAAVREDSVIITLTDDQALVLSDWLERMEGSEAFNALVDDQAVWAALNRISGTLDKSLVGIFAPDYAERLQAARQRIVGTGED